MRALWLLVWLASPGAVAWAAEPEIAWVVGETPSRRFQGEPTVGPTFDAGARVTVLWRAGEVVRVFAGERYGWLPASALTATAPAGSEGPMGALKGLPMGLPPGMPDINLKPQTAPQAPAAPPKP